MTSIARTWLARILGRGETRNDVPDNPTDLTNSSYPAGTLDEVRRASAAVASRPIEVILDESRRLAPMASDIVQNVGRALTPGTTTAEIADQLVRGAKSRGVLPAMLGYRGFPAGAAVSINDELLHGIPSNRRILAGDLVKIEFGIVSSVAFAANSWTYPVGAPSPEDAALLECGTKALEMAIETISPKGRLGDIGAAIQTEAERMGLEVVRAFVGHGMGQQRIQEPQVAGTGRKGTGARLRKGWILNVHVILKRGTRDIEIANNGWTAPRGRQAARLSIHLHGGGDGDWTPSTLDCMSHEPCKLGALKMDAVLMCPSSDMLDQINGFGKSRLLEKLATIDRRPDMRFEP